MSKSPKIKTEEEIMLMRESGKRLASTMLELEKIVQVGISTLDIDKKAERLILKMGGTPSFKGYGGPDNAFPATICASLNEEIVHGIPSKKRILKNGDIFKIDIGMKYKGWHSDMARTFAVGDVSEEGARIIETVRQTFYQGVSAMKVGKKLNIYSKAVQKFAEKKGFSVVRNLVGHGIGKELHEYPQIPNYFDKKSCNFKLRNGMTFALEPMINSGTYKTVLADDDWTFKTADNSLSAHWENTVLVTKKGIEILTKV